MFAGGIYVLRNENMKELLVKVGKTLRPAEKRAAELAKATGVVGKFHVLFQEPVVDIDYAEQLVHERLKAYRLEANREFFQVPYELAIRTVFDTCREVNKNLPPAPIVRVRIGLNGQVNARRLQEVLAPHRGGDVQVLVVFENANAYARSRSATRGACISRHYLWKNCRLGWASNVLFVRWPVDGSPLQSDPFIAF
jgi:hypothetical protein